MNKILKLTVTNFDSSENSTSLAEHITEEKYFIDGDDVPAYAKCKEYVSKMTSTFYLGWNEKVYPKFTVTAIYVE